MSFEQTIAELNIFCAHENAAIAEFAGKAIIYGQALANREISQNEYNDLMADIETLKGMCRTADEEYQVAKIFQLVTNLPALL
jgi:hypothetical protein